MVHLDHGLIRLARNLTTGANVHRAKQKILDYERAVLLHNTSTPGHEVYQEKYETELRRFNEAEGIKRAALLLERDSAFANLDERNKAVMDRAAEAVRTSEGIHKRCAELNVRVTKALSHGSGTDAFSPVQDPEKQ